MTYLVTQMVRNPPAVQETWVHSLGREDPLEKGMATYSSILAQKIPWIADPGGLQSMVSQRLRHDWVTNTFTVSFNLHWKITLDVLKIRNWRRLGDELGGCPSRYRDQWKSLQKNSQQWKMKEHHHLCQLCSLINQDSSFPTGERPQSP